MRRFILLVALLATICTADARDITTLKGQTYRVITVTRVEKNGISITHADGVAFLDFENLSRALQIEFGYTEAGYVAATAAEKNRQEAVLESQRRLTAEFAAQQAEQRRQVADAKLAVINAQRLAVALASTPPPSSIAARDYSSVDRTERDYGADRYPTGTSSGGTVHVSGYTRKNGTYVHAYTRRR